MTYYCPLVVLDSSVSANASIPSSVPFTWLPCPGLSPLRLPSLPYHTQTFRGSTRCTTWHRAPIMRCCVHSGFALNGALEQCQQKQEPWCFVAIVRPGLVSIRYCLVGVLHRNCRQNVIRPVEKGRAHNSGKMQVWLFAQAQHKYTKGHSSGNWSPLHSFFSSSWHTMHTKPFSISFLLILKTCLFPFLDPCFSRCLIGVLTWNGSNKQRGKGSSSTDEARTHTVKSHMSNERLYRLWRMAPQSPVRPPSWESSPTRGLSLKTKPHSFISLLRWTSIIH